VTDRLSLDPLPLNPPSLDRPAHDIARGSVIVLTLDLQYRVRYCSPAFAAAGGAAARMLYGQPFDRLRHPDMPRQVLRDLWDALERGHACVAPLKLRCPDGGHLWARAAFSRVVDRQGTMSIVVVLTRPGRVHVRGAEALYASRRCRTGVWLDSLLEHDRELPCVLKW
jgi:PAS domain S-box-containing protein